MIIEQNLNDVIKFLFNDSNFIEENRLGDAITVDLKQDIVQLDSEDSILCIIDLKSASLNGDVYLTNDGVTISKITGSNQAVDNEGAILFCKEIDAYGMDDSSSEVTVVFKVYTRK